MAGDPVTAAPADLPQLAPRWLSRSAWIAVAATANLAVTFGYQWFPVVKLGAGAETDALFVSAIVPQIVLSVISTSLTSVLTPMLSTASATAFRMQAWTVGLGVALAAAALNGVLYLSAGIWVPWLVPGFDAPVRALTLDLVRVQLIGAFFTMLLAVQWSASYARDRFLWVEASGMLAGTVALAGAWWSMDRYGVYAVAWALTFRAGLQVVLLMPALGRVTRPAWHAAGGMEMWRRLLPLLGGSVYYKADPIVERVLASFALPGHLSLFHLAQQVYAGGNQVLTRALINPIMPRLARHAKQAEWAAFTQLVRHRVLLSSLLFAVAWLGLLVAGRPVMHVALRAWLEPEQVRLLHALLVLLVGVWFGGAAGQVFTVAFYAFGNTVTPTRTGVVAFTLAIPLKIAAYWMGGILGLAVATSLYTFGTAVVHHLFLRRDIGRLAAAAGTVP
jgi:putative peptidoglycan lipid II flippase